MPTDYRCLKPGHTGYVGRCQQCLAELNANMPAALGIPSPDGPTRATPEQAEKVLSIAVKYLLYERSEETALTAAFAQLCAERHNHFHVKAFDKEIPWTECNNPVCRDALQIVTATKKREVIINPLAAQLMARYRVNFMPMPQYLRFWLSDLDETALPATETQKREASKIVLAN